MHKLILFFSLLASIVFVACEEKETPFNEFEDLEYGAIPRLVEGPTGVFDYLNPSDSKIEFTVEFYDENQGKGVASYTWGVQYDNIIAEQLDITSEQLEITVDTTINGMDTVITRDTMIMQEADTVVVAEADTMSYGPVDLASITSDAFRTNAAGFPTAILTFTLPEVLGALGVTIDSLQEGGTFTFDATLVKTDGKTFDAENTSGNLQGQPAFNAFFTFEQALVCPSDIGGAYIATAEGESANVCCPGTVSLDGVEITLEDEGEGSYVISDYSAGLYLSWYGPGGSIDQVEEADQTDGGLSATVVEKCNTFTGSFTDFFGAEGTIMGTVDPETGIISYTFDNSSDDQIRVVLTPQ